LTAKKKAAAKPTAKKKAAAKPGRRSDFGAPIDAFFAKHPPHLRAVLEALRALVEEAAPAATASIKWGMPFYSVGPAMMCALGGFKTHVNLVLAGPPEAFADPDGLLEGDGKTGRRLKLRTLEDLPRSAVRVWLRAAASFATKKAKSG
jgi:hypothetical protein